jgi:hypothetical protein
MQRIKHIHETFARRDDDALGGEKDELAMRHLKLRSIRSPDFEGHKSALQSFTNVLDCHGVNIRFNPRVVKTPNSAGGKRLQLFAPSPWPSPKQA